MAITNHNKQTEEALENMEKMLEGGISQVRAAYTPAYIDAVFTIWYQRGQPKANRLFKSLPDPAQFGIADTRPSTYTLKGWIENVFVERALALDEEVSRRMAETMIAEKVAMLQSHARLANEMQGMAMGFFEHFPEKLNAMVALRLLVEGIRIERESVGIPRTLEKMSNQSDEELLATIQDLLTKSEISALEPAGAEEDDAL
jgi:hypothetical protein